MTHWGLDPIFGTAWVPVTVLVGLGSLLLLSPTYRSTSNRRRQTLIGIRLALIVLIFLAMLRPTRVSTSLKAQDQVLLFLVDVSRSMQLPHVSGGPSRWEAQQALLRDAERVIGDFDASFRFKVYGFDSSLHPIEFSERKFRLPEQPAGEQTDIGSNLIEALENESSGRVAGILLLGDGTQTAFEPRVDLSQTARELTRMGYPLYSVVFGQKGDVAQSRDLAVENLPEQYTIFVKNELQVRGHVRVRGYTNQNISVELLAENVATGWKQTIGPQVISVREDGQTAPTDLRFTPDQPGQYRLTLRAPPLSGELVTKNNELTSFVTVLEGGLRVLYLYGDLLGEQRILRRSLNDSAEIELFDIYVDPRNRQRWPIELDEYLVTPKYDVLLIESVESAAISDQDQNAIIRATESGRGLMMIGGFHSFGPGGYSTAPLGKLLPVKMSRFEKQDAGPSAKIAKDLHVWGPLSLSPTRAHPITQLGPGIENAARWQQLPQLHGANRFGDLADRAVVLLETTDHQPVLVAGAFGTGRVLGFAGNTTFRWWQRGKQTEHRRFWRQSILWLAQREGNEQNDVWIRLEQRRFAPGTKVVFKGGAKSPNGETIPGATFTAELFTAQGVRSPIRLLASGDQVAGTIEQALAAGDYILELRALEGDRQLGKARASFQVLDRDVEFANPIAGHDQLARLSEATADVGGRVLSPEELVPLLSKIQQDPPKAIAEVESRWRLADRSFEGWLILLIVSAALTTEWYLRKRWGLV